MEFSLQWRSEGIWRPGGKLEFCTPSPPPSNKFLKNDNEMSSIQLIMCLINSAPLHINPVKQYTKFKVGGHVSLVVKISLHTPFCGCCGKCSN